MDSEAQKDKQTINFPIHPSFISYCRLIDRSERNLRYNVLVSQNPRDAFMQLFPVEPVKVFNVQLCTNIKKKGGLEFFISFFIYLSILDVSSRV